MLAAYNTLHFGGSVIAIGATPDGGRFVCNDYGVYSTDSAFRTYENTNILFKDVEKSHKYSKMHSISPAGLIAMSPPKSNKLAIFAPENNRYAFQKNLEWHKAYVTHSEFGSEIFVSGGEDGRAFVYQMPNFDLLAILPPMADYISTIAIDEAEHYIAYSSYGSLTSIYDNFLARVMMSFNTGDVVESSAFINETQLFFVCRNGEFGVYDIATRDFAAHSKISGAWLMAFDFSLDRKFAFVIGRDAYLYIIRLSDCTKMDTIDIEIEGGASVKVVDNLLMIGAVSGDVKIYDTEKLADKFTALIEKDELKEAQALANEKNKILKTLPVYTDALEARWPGALKTAIDYISVSNFTQAVASVNLFLDDPRKNKEIQFYMSKQDAIIELVEAVEKKNFVTAYKIVEAAPEFKKLEIYRQLEFEWDNYMNKLRDFMLLNPAKNRPVVVSALKTLSVIFSKKEFVSAFSNNLNQCVIANDMYKAKRFVEFFALCQKHEFLKTMRIFQKLMAFFNSRLEEARALEFRREYPKALEILNTLSKLAPYAETATNLIEQIQMKSSFFESYEKKDFVRCLEMCVDPKYADVKVLEEYSIIINSVKAELKEALEHASKGNIEPVYNMVEMYGEIEALKMKCYLTMKIAYLYEIRLAQYENRADVDWEASLRQFVVQFGKSAELANACTGADAVEALHNIPEVQIDESNDGIYQYQPSILIIKDGAASGAGADSAGGAGAGSTGAGGAVGAAGRGTGGAGASGAAGRGAGSLGGSGSLGGARRR